MSSRGERARLEPREPLETLGEDLGAGDEHRGECRHERDHTDGDAAQGLRLIGIQVMVAVRV